MTDNDVYWYCRHCGDRIHRSRHAARFDKLLKELGYAVPRGGASYWWYDDTGKAKCTGAEYHEP